MASVFLSSTVYDLIDVRAELRQCLLDAGYSVSMSDRGDSDFELQHDTNSIETCLRNVDRAEAVIVVLSQRYGGRLAKAGFPDLSATHLEYRRARERGKKTLVYARSNLEAEYYLWAKNHSQTPLAAGGAAALPALKYGWVQKDADHKLFELLEEHRLLDAGRSQSNWVSVFNDTVDLKRQVVRDMRLVAGRSHLERLIRENRIPALALDCRPKGRNTTGEILLEQEIRNLGSVPAHRVTWQFTHPCGKPNAIPSLASGQSSVHLIAIPGDASDCEMLVSYSTPEGHQVRDTYSLRVRARDARLVAGYDFLDRVYVVGTAPPQFTILDPPASA